MQRTVSVVVIIKNEEHLLPYTMPCFASLGSALQEVIYVDDCSTDNSEQVAHDIAAKFKHFPLVWIPHEMKRWDEQRNIGLDRATGDLIISIDADMSFTGNMIWEIEKGAFDRHDVFDFSIFVCKPDVYHYDKQTAAGFNLTTRLVKNSGVRYAGAAHEQPDTYSGPNRTTLPTCKTGTLPAKGYNRNVRLFELSPLSPDDALRERGRRLERWRKEMTDRGIPPPAPDRYYNFKYNGSEVVAFPPDVRDMIVTMEDALHHWGK